MKKILFLAGAIILAIPAFAKNGFYLSPSVGAGMSNVKIDHAYNSPNEKSGLLSYNAKIGIGYKYKNWRFQVGLQYLTTGYKLNNLLFGSDFDPTKLIIIGTGSYQITYTHLGVPLQVGYTLRPEKKLSIIPYAGILTSYNLGAKSIINESGNETINTWTKEQFKNRYNTISIWGITALQLEYKVNERISIVGGPCVNYMISNFSQNPSVIVHESIQRNYAFNFDLGVKINL
jgi:hypothetical protein